MSTVAPLPAASKGRLDGIEAGRGLAASMVVFYHASNHLERNIGYKPWGGWAQFGHAGVDFFFVLSGFIIYFVHAADLGRPNRLGHYAKRRVTRIYPVYWFVLVLSLALALAASAHEAPSWSFVLRSAALVPTIDEPFIGVAWTLQHEMIFYVLFGIAIVSLRAGLVVFAAWFLAIAVSAAGGLDAGGSALLHRLLSLFDIEFFLGMGAAWLTMRAYVRNTRPFLVLGIVCFALTAIAEDLSWLDGLSAYGRVGYGLSSMLLVLGASGIGRSQHAIFRGLRMLGSASYSIYLVHLLCIGIVYKIFERSGLFDRLPVSVMYIAFCVAGIAGGIVVSRYAEYPLMGLFRRLLGRPTHQPKLA